MSSYSRDGFHPRPSRWTGAREELEVKAEVFESSVVLIASSGALQLVSVRVESCEVDAAPQYGGPARCGL